MFSVSCLFQYNKNLSSCLTFHHLFLYREVRNANADMKAKIQKLVDVGLLGFAQ